MNDDHRRALETIGHWPVRRVVRTTRRPSQQLIFEHLACGHTIENYDPSATFKAAKERQCGACAIDGRP